MDRAQTLDAEAQSAVELLARRRLQNRLAQRKRRQKRAEMEKTRQQVAESHQGKRSVSRLEGGSPERCNYDQEDSITRPLKDHLCQGLKEPTGATQVIHAGTETTISPLIEPCTETVTLGDILDFSEDSFSICFGLDSPKVITESHDLTPTNTFDHAVPLRRLECASSLEAEPFDKAFHEKKARGMSDSKNTQLESPISVTKLHRRTSSTSSVLLNHQSPCPSTSHTGGPCQENKGKTALHLCAERGNTVMVDILLDHSVDLDVPDGCGRTALHTAVRHGRVEVVSKLLEAGADTEIADHVGFSPIHSAAASENNEIVRLLMRGGADIHAGIRTYDGTHGASR